MRLIAFFLCAFSGFLVGLMLSAAVAVAPGDTAGKGTCHGPDNERFRWEHTAKGGGLAVEKVPCPEPPVVEAPLTVVEDETRASPVRSGGASTTGAPDYVIGCESSGDPTAVNGGNPDRPAGLYQIITSTWASYGGTEFAPTADLATPEQQAEIAARIYAAEGSSPWACG